MDPNAERNTSSFNPRSQGYVILPITAEMQDAGFTGLQLPERSTQPPYAPSTQGVSDNVDSRLADLKRSAQRQISTPDLQAESDVTRLRKIHDAIYEEFKRARSTMLPGSRTGSNPNSGAWEREYLVARILTYQDASLSYEETEEAIRLLVAARASRTRRERKQQRRADAADSQDGQAGGSTT